MSWTAVRKMGSGLRVVGNAGDHRQLQSPGDLTSLVRPPLANDDQTQVPAFSRAEPRVITKCR